MRYAPHRMADNIYVGRMMLMKSTLIAPIKKNQITAGAIMKRVLVIIKIILKDQ
jgi:hypothetical protein